VELNLEDLINKEKLKPCLILGPGETMTQFPFDKFKGKIIVIGNAALRGEGLFTPDYWIASNNHFPVPYLQLHRNIINKFKKTVFLFAESVLHDHLWKKSPQVLKKYLKVDWLFYDERHFCFKKCSPELKCCKHIKNKQYNYSTIQELVSKIYKHKVIASPGRTVFEYALALALIMGCSPIYIQGVDLPISVSKDFLNKIKLEKENDWVRYGELGYKYAENIDYKILRKIRNLNLKTQMIIKKQSKKIFYENKNNPIYFFYSIIKKIFQKKTYSSFKDDIFLILRNVGIYANIAKKNKIKIYNLSKNSSLNKIKDITFLQKNNFLS